VTTAAVDGTTRALKVDASGSSAPAGVATAARQDTGNASLANIDADTTTIANRLPTTLGQKASSASLAVVVASDQTLDVSGTVAISNNVTTDSVSATPSASGAPIAVAGDNALVVPSSSRRRDVRLESVGMVAVKCGFGVVNAATTYSFILKGGTAAYDGLGGSVAFQNLSGVATISCVRASAGSTAVAVSILSY
jgi:hypothetical protein